MNYAAWRARLAQANPPELYPVEWLDEHVERGLSVPIIGDNAAMVVGVRLYPGGARVGLIRAAAGNLDELVSVLAPIAEDWGRRQGCSMAMLEGRCGWQRALKEHGWSTHQIVLKKDL